MTYGIGMHLRDGLVFLSDSRTNAGVDDISTFGKMTVWEQPGERVLTMLTAGNLAISQAVINQLNEGLPHQDNDPDGTRETLYSVPTLFQAARLAGRAVRTVQKLDAPHIAPTEDLANITAFSAARSRGSHRPCS